MKLGRSLLLLCLLIFLVCEVKATTIRPFPNLGEMAKATESVVLVRALSNYENNISGVTSFRTSFRVLKSIKGTIVPGSDIDVQHYHKKIGDLERKLLGLDPAVGNIQIYTNKGCTACEFTGYKGRIAIVEILRINDYMKKLISNKTSAHEILKAAVATGFKTLADDACRRVMEGSSSLDEITRKVDLTSRVSG